jgi:hypothetical protein
MLEKYLRPPQNGFLPHPIQFICHWSICPSTIHSSSVVIYTINKANSKYRIYSLTGKQFIVADVAPHAHYNTIPFLTAPFMSEVKWHPTHALCSSCPTPACTDIFWRVALIINASLISQPSDNCLKLSYRRAHPRPSSLELNLWPSTGCPQREERKCILKWRCKYLIFYASKL